MAPLLSGSSVFRVTRCTSLTFSTQFPIPVFRPTSSVSNKWAEPFVSFYAQYQTSSLSPVPLCVGMRGQDFKSQQVLHETFRVMLRRGVSPLLPFVASGKDVAILQDAEFTVLAQREMEKRRSPLLSVPPFGRGFSRHGVFRSDGGWAAQERALTPPFIVSMSPPGYPSAWLRPRSARFCFARQNHCNSATSGRFSTSGLPVTPPEPRPARPES